MMAPVDRLVAGDLEALADLEALVDLEALADLEGLVGPWLPLEMCHP
jgi:hypothetical protein